MGPADALSRKNVVNTNNDNQEITLLKGGDQYYHIRAIDNALAEKIASSSPSDPIATMLFYEVVDLWISLNFPSFSGLS